MKILFFMAVIYFWDAVFVICHNDGYKRDPIRNLFLAITIVLALAFTVAVIIGFFNPEIFNDIRRLLCV